MYRMSALSDLLTNPEAIETKDLTGEYSLTSISNYLFFKNVCVCSSFQILVNHVVLPRIA